MEMMTSEWKKREDDYFMITMVMIFKNIYIVRYDSDFEMTETRRIMILGLQTSCEGDGFMIAEFVKMMMSK